MAQTFIGRIISLTSSSDIRYRGILEGIDQAASTITLKNVYQMGTEDRRPINSPEFIPPSMEPYDTIVFRALNVKDISVDDHQPPPAQRAPPNDPAVLSTTQQPAQQHVGHAQHYPSYAPVHNAYQPQAHVHPAQMQQPMYSNHPPAPQQGHAHVPQIQPQQGSRPRRDRVQPSPPPTSNATANTNGGSKSTKTNRAPGSNGSQPPSAVRAAEVSLEHVGRALTNLRVSNEQPRQHNGRGRQNDIKSGEIRFPASDFDFAQSNARFDKSAVGVSAQPVARRIDVDQKTNPSDSDDDEEVAASHGKKKDETKEKFYDPSKSFFDSLSTSAPPSAGGRGNGTGRRGGGGGGRAGRGRNRREEEREKNMSTFGEPGGVGLLGPGAYVGGWGSGGAGPRRGRGGAQAGQQGTRRG